MLKPPRADTLWRWTPSGKEVSFMILPSPQHETRSAKSFADAIMDKGAKHVAMHGPMINCVHSYTAVGF